MNRERTAMPQSERQVQGEQFLLGMANKHGIFTPLEFLHAPLHLLRERVFHSVVGYYWYRRLRGWEVDAIEFERKSFGQDYALGKPTADRPGKKGASPHPPPLRTVRATLTAHGSSKPRTSQSEGQVEVADMESALCA